MIGVFRIEIGPNHSDWIFGPHNVIRVALNAANCPRQYDPKRGAVAIPKRRTDDVIAALESGRHGISVETVQVLE